MQLSQKTLFGGLALAAGCVLLSTCNPAPHYVKPPAALPPAFKEAVPQEYKEGTGWKIAEPGDDKIRPKWWEMYNDPQLNALEEQVHVSNQSIIAAEANFRAARALVQSARAALFPTITTSPSYTNSRFSSTSVTSSALAAGGTGTTALTSSTGAAPRTSTSGGGAAGTVINDFTLPVDVTYTVDLWHRIRNTVAANAFSAQASAADIATALLSTQAQLAQDYFEVRALDAEREIYRQTVESYRRSLDLTLTLFETGIDSDEDVAQARTQWQTAMAQATDLGVSRAQYEHAIATLIGKPAAEFALPVAEFVPKPPPVPVALPSKLLERRPDIAALERQVAADNAQIGVARAAYYPNLSLSATGGFESSHFLEWLTWPSRFWSVGPTLAETLFDGGARRAATEQAQATYDAAVANYRQTVLTDFQAVEDNLAALRILNQEVNEQQMAIDSSGQYLNLSTTRYKAGIDSYLNVLSAQTTLLTNRQAQVQMQLRQMTSSVLLIMALGGGWDQSQLPQIKDLAAKSQKSNTNEALPTPANVAAPNPPPLPAKN
jgi:NodT family efflux transporter outer membrane factor (OMF) lipoprotein